MTVQERTNRRRTVVRAGALGAALVATLGLTTGCGSSSASSESNVKDLKVAVMNLAASAPYYVAQEKGYFKDAGLNVKLVSAAGAAEGVPPLVSGTIQVGSGNLITVMQAAEQGIQLTSIATTNEAAPSLDDIGHKTSAVMVRPDSGIKSPKDLEGKTIAVNALNGLGDATIKASLVKQGVDVDSLKFTELTFPDMLTAIDAKRVDAIWEVEPFVMAGKKAGLKPISYNFEEAALRLPLGVSFVTKQFADKNPETIKKFKQAMDRAIDYLNEDEQRIRDAGVSVAKISPEVAAKMALPDMTTSFSRESVQSLADLSKEYGLLKKDPDLDAQFGLVLEDK
ncbi:hypothetical protein SRB5_18770 [Streptomyces sp. RB5]|uniref:SsuA/THI5-like domain-containing protein n=1 Tax=Streptomyces smaragdinus TaxID=2585196 RepID=A0A7K0CE56_9ACTN|nr:ABC transporter substrate-binding protein [Streptomyces smaragdinus]MQY11758.1 hypothetical protein [Streptomyces smaragdinus]